MPPRNVIAGERFQVVYRLTNGQGSSLNAPAINGCSLLYGPSTSSSYSTQIINGVATSNSSVDYAYVYRAEKEGSFTIPAASIIVDGKKLTADARQFTVLPADKRQSGQSGAVLGDYDTQTPDKAISKSDIFVRIILNKSTAYEQEAIECILKLYTKYESITSFSQTNPATYDGFLIDEVQQPAQLNQVENYNGQNYRTAILKKSIIFPQKTGKLTISSGSYDVTLQQMERVNTGFFSMARPVERNVKLSPYTATVNVRPLPQPQPAGFTGAVGNFTASTTLSSSSLRTGEAASIKYIVKGTGNIKYLNLPTLDFPADFEQYNPRQDFDTHVSGTTVTGTMTAEYTFVPQSTGEYKIDCGDFIYFEPSSSSYKTISLDDYKLSVAKGAGSHTVVDQQNIKLANTDILHIRLGDTDLSHNYSIIGRSVWYWLIYPVALVLFIISAWSFARRMKHRSDEGRMKVARAAKVARKRLSLAEKNLKSGNTAQFYESLLKALWGYLGDRLRLPVSELSRINVADELTRSGASDELSAKVISLIDDCEMARYAPSAALPPKEIYEQTVEVISQLQNLKK